MQHIFKVLNDSGSSLKVFTITEREVNFRIFLVVQLSNEDTPRNFDFTIAKDALMNAEMTWEQSDQYIATQIKGYTNPQMAKIINFSPKINQNEPS